jgi:hypothetical protein
MTKEERNEHWQRIIAEQEASGMTPRAFCLQRRINPSRFYHRRIRLREHHDNGNGILQLFPTTPAPSPGGHPGLRIYLYPSPCTEVCRDLVLR